jgi:purine-cytosine permease-like protein
MEFLLSHWHCILPVVGIVVAMFFMRDKKSKANNKNDYERN